MAQRKILFSLPAHELLTNLIANVCLMNLGPKPPVNAAIALLAAVG